MECVICKQKITADPFGWDGGCNAEPVASGQCCYRCDIDVVIPTRLAQYGIKSDDVENVVADIRSEVSKVNGNNLTS